MKTLFTALIISCLVFSGFEGRRKIKTLDFVPGTYSVCEAYTQVVLQISKSGSYTYLDNTTKTPLKLEGKWTRSDNVIVLGETGNVKIHDHWKIDEGTPCLRARKGLEWRRLCLVKAE